MAFTEHYQPSIFKTLMIIVLLLFIVIFKAGLAYIIIGDRGQPDWDYRPVQDVPGESPYAVYEYMPFPQHVMGGQSDYPPLEETWNEQLERNWDKSFFPDPQQNAIWENQ